MFDSDGNPIGGTAEIVVKVIATGDETTTTVHYKGNDKAIAVALWVDLSRPSSPASPPTPAHTSMSVTKGKDGKTKARVKKTRRADGTLLQSSEILIEGEKPIKTIVKTYETDGKTLIKKQVIDLTHLTYDPKTRQVAGKLALESLFRGTTPESHARVSY